MKILSWLLVISLPLIVVACDKESAPFESPPKYTPHTTATPTPADPDDNATCILSGGGIVKKGWSGKDTGSNYCNRCKCMDFGLACTRMACPATPIVSWPLTPTPTPAMSPVVTPRE